MPKKKRLNIVLPPEIHRLAYSAADRQEMLISEWIEEAIRAKLQGEGFVTVVTVPGVAPESTRGRA